MNFFVPKEEPLLPGGQFSKAWRLFFQQIASTFGNLTFPSSGTLATVNGQMAAGGTVIQATNKATGVTLNTVTGRITTANTSLAAATTVTFTLTNSNIAATDIVLVQLQSGNAGAGTYQVWAESSGSGTVVVAIRNTTAGALAETLVLSFAVVKSVTS